MFCIGDVSSVYILVMSKKKQKNNLKVNVICWFCDAKTNRLSEPCLDLNFWSRSKQASDILLQKCQIHFGILTFLRF